MRKITTVLATILTLGFSINVYTQGLVAMPTHERVNKNDLLKNIYSELKVGMTLAEVRNLTEKHYPKLKLEDTDIWGGFDSNSPYFSWVLGAGEKRKINVSSKPGDGVTYVARIFLRIDFDDKSKLINAVYVRDSKKGFKEGRSVVEEHLALVGDGYYK